MPTEIKNDPRHDFVRRILPWLVAVVMLAVYCLTLNPWVSLINLDTVSRVSGWVWTPDFGGPLFHLAMLPFRMLPVGAIPVALNLFSALCAALTLGLLTRSVGLLPHDRTEAQVVRERNGFALLTLRSAWLPPLLAALLCGLQLTFWQLATNGSSAMFDLLMFAFVVWSLLEYRLDEREWRLYLSAVVVGAGVAEGVPMTGFFPLFIVAVIWVRGLNFFNVRFLWRMTLLGLAGLSLIWLPPITAIISDRASGTFLQAVRLTMGPQAMVVKDYFACVTNPSATLENMVPLFVSLMPLLILSIRWKIGDSSRVGSALANLMFYGIHAIFLCVCIWLVFDPPFSPRQRGMGLTLYYLIALSAGYYAGYFLLIFGKKHPRAGEFQPVLAVLFNRTVIALIWLLAILAVAGLIYKNKALVCAANGNSLAQYTSLLAGKLPHAGAIVLSDDRNQLFLTGAELAREGRAKDYLLIDTTSLLYPEYHRYLHREFPKTWPLLVASTNSSQLNPVGMVGMLSMLNRSNELYYLQPSFGNYYFERFYSEPHGLVYKLKPLPADTLLPPLPDNNLIAENEAFWADAQSQGLKSVEDTLALQDPNSPEPLAQKIFARLHIPREQDLGTLVIGAYCSRCLDFWGVEQQQAGYLTTAAESFKTALELNPGNAVAQINLKFNEALRAGQHPRVDLNQDTSDQLGKYSSVSDAISEGGPFDEPNFCYQFGDNLMNARGFYRQAVAPLERVCELDPNFFPARSLLAQIYGINHLPSRMLRVLRAPIEKPENFSLDLADSTDLHVLAAAAYFQMDDKAHGSQMFEMEISRDPGNDALLSTVERVYISRGMYSNALAVAEHRLTLAPDDQKWLITKGYLENQLKQYNDAIKTLTRAVAAQNDNADALFQRGRAYYLSGNFDAARADYETLQRSQTNSYLFAYALGEIARQQHITNEAIRNYEIYLRNVPTNNTADIKTISERLQELKQPTGSK